MMNKFSKNNTFIIRLYHIIFIPLFFYGCSSSSETKSGELDIPLEGAVTKEKSEEKKADAKKETPPVLAMPPTAAEMFKWQSYFKPEPNMDERRLIARKIEEWKKADSPEILLKRAKNQMALSQIAAAEASYIELLRQQPENLDALLDMASLYLRKRQIERAFDYLTQTKKSMNALENVPKTVKFKYRYTLSLALLARGERKEAHKILSDLIAADKEFTPGYATLASSYLASDKLDSAEFIARRGMDRGKPDPRLTNILAIISYKKGDYITTRRQINQTLDMDPNFTPALINRANLSIIHEGYDAAESDLKKVIELSPDSVEAYILLGIVQKKTGRFESAELSFSKAIELNPESAFARFNLAILMADSLGKPGPALRLFHEVIQTSENNDEIKQLAKIHIEGIRENRLMQENL
ncbi:MAG: tetratricopeptide repeat protein [Oligoflexales bacterium]|nr:tetratricopeptide repeat protein [Oligoflexales bacterium]